MISRRSGPLHRTPEELREMFIDLLRIIEKPREDSKLKLDTTHSIGFKRTFAVLYIYEALLVGPLVIVNHILPNSMVATGIFIVALLMAPPIASWTIQWLNIPKQSRMGELCRFLLTAMLVLVGLLLLSILIAYILFQRVAQVPEGLWELLVLSKFWLIVAFYLISLASLPLAFSGLRELYCCSRDIHPRLLILVGLLYGLIVAWIPLTIGYLFVKGAPKHLALADGNTLIERIVYFSLFGSLAIYFFASFVWSLALGLKSIGQQAISMFTEIWLWLKHLFSPLSQKVAEDSSVVGEIAERIASRPCEGGLGLDLQEISIIEDFIHGELREIELRFSLTALLPNILAIILSTIAISIGLIGGQSAQVLTLILTIIGIIVLTVFIAFLYSLILFSWHSRPLTILAEACVMAKSILQLLERNDILCAAAQEEGLLAENPNER